MHIITPISLHLPNNSTWFQCVSTLCREWLIHCRLTFKSLNYPWNSSSSFIDSLSFLLFKHFLFCHLLPHTHSSIFNIITYNWTTPFQEKAVVSSLRRILVCSFSDRSSSFSNLFLFFLRRIRLKSNKVQDSIVDYFSITQHLPLKEVSRICKHSNWSFSSIVGTWIANRATVMIIFTQLELFNHFSMGLLMTRPISLPSEKKTRRVRSVRSESRARCRNYYIQRARNKEATQKFEILFFFWSSCRKGTIINFRKFSVL